MTYLFGGEGHIGDNSDIAFFIRASCSCDGTEGLRATLPERYRREFWADAIHFLRELPGADLPDVPHDARLVLYIIAAGSVPRIKIGDTWHIVSPDYFPGYGDPYGFAWRGHKAVIESHGLTWDGINDIIIEHISPGRDQIGAQVVFVMEWDAK